MNTIYSLSHLVDWIEFAKTMEQKLGWRPVYWLTTEVTDKPVQIQFPEAIRHKYVDIIQGKSPDNVDLFSSYSIDDKILDAYSYEMDQAIKMMDRLDSGDAFSYNERKRYFLKILNYSLNVVSFFKPLIIVFTEVPHHATQYILYAVCKRNNVKTIMFKPVFVFDLRLLIYNSIDDSPLQSLGNSTLSEEEEPLGLIQSYVLRLKGDYTEAEPEYMIKQKKTSKLFLTYIKTIHRLVTNEKLSNLINRRKTSNILKLKGRRIEESLPNRFQLYWLKVKAGVKKNNLQKLYNKLSIKKPSLEKPFVFVPLQYQPERTSSPDGGAYVDQYLMINLLRSAFPLDIPIYVKEHTSQFHPKMDGHLGRFFNDYYDFVALKNVHLIPTSLSSFQLIDSCLAVATLTGTVGLEAIARRKPVLIFGPGCWYRSLRGSIYINDTETLHNAVSKILNQEIVFGVDDLTDFLKNFFQKSFRGKLNPNFPSNLSKEENVLNFSTAVEKYFRIVYKVN